MSNGNLMAINHVVVLMLENRSFDHMLGFLYSDTGNVSPAGQPFDGLTASESNPDSNGKAVPSRIISSTGQSTDTMPNRSRAPLSRTSPTRPRRTLGSLPTSRRPPRQARYRPSRFSSRAGDRAATASIRTTTWRSESN
jgi:Phosphoesterase family